jgi:hypothetical protein
MRRPSVATLMPLIPLATGCTAIAAVHQPAQFIVAKAPAIVWITAADNSEVALLAPKVKADTLAGLVEGVHYVEMPLSSVHSMRARQPALRRTLLLLGGATLGVTGVVVAASHASGAPYFPACVSPDDAQKCAVGAPR